MSNQGDNRFHTTMWSVVLRAGEAPSPQRELALEQLCRLYWRPLHGFCLAQGRTKADSDDLTQGFFAHLLGKDVFRVADPGRGRFRSFLLASFRNFISGEADRAGAMRRGGGVTHIPFDLEFKELPCLGPSPDITPERAYDLRWAHDLVARATDQLRQETAANGKQAWFEWIVGHRAGACYADIAVEIGTTEEAVKSFAKRTRRRFREILEIAVADTVDSPEDLVEEMAYLAELLRK